MARDNNAWREIQGKVRLIPCKSLRVPYHTTRPGPMANTIHLGHGFLGRHCHGEKDGLTCCSHPKSDIQRYTVFYHGGSIRQSWLIVIDGSTLHYFVVFHLKPGMLEAIITSCKRTSHNLITCCLKKFFMCALFSVLVF